jgi:hypothetical protein
MAIEYTVALKITVSTVNPDATVVIEEFNFPGLSFAEMTRRSSEYYALIAKLQKE